MRLALVVGLLLLAPATAMAHAVGLSTTSLRSEGPDVMAELAFARADLDLPAAEVAGQVSVESGGARCPGALESTSRIEPDGVQLVVRFRCPRPAASVTFSLPLLETLGHGHRHLLTAGETRTVLDRTQPSATVALAGRSPAPGESGTSTTTGPRGSCCAPGASPSRAGGRFGRLVALGVEHILTGADHLVFLLGLLLIGGRPRTLLRTITAFTAGHSVTLGCGALGLWTPGPRWIEPLIALSIAYVGVENLLHARPDGRWKLALAFGMIHGFGFSGALTQLALPRAQLLPALLAFNTGVELGQLSVLALVLPLLALARRWPPFPRYVIPALSAAIVVPGLIWFVVRVSAG